MKICLLLLVSASSVSFASSFWRVVVERLRSWSESSTVTVSLVLDRLLEFRLCSRPSSLFRGVQQLPWRPSPTSQPESPTPSMSTTDAIREERVKLPELKIRNQLLSLVKTPQDANVPAKSVSPFTATLLLQSRPSPGRPALPFILADRLLVGGAEVGTGGTF